MGHLLQPHYRAAQEFADRGGADPQNGPDFGIPEPFQSQIKTTPLLVGESFDSLVESLRPLACEQALFRIQLRIHQADLDLGVVGRLGVLPRAHEKSDRHGADLVVPFEMRADRRPGVDAIDVVIREKNGLARLSALEGRQPDPLVVVTNGTDEAFRKLRRRREPTAACCPRRRRRHRRHPDEKGKPKLDLTLTTDQAPVGLAGTASEGATNPPPARSRKELQTAALVAMQERRNTDVALLQRRDIFELPDAARRLSLQEQMDTVFWKGDFVVHIDVTGAQLKSVMDQSRQFDLDDGNVFDSGLERGRGLLSLGIWQDDDKNWSVNGATIDPNRLYSVAATDYLAFGDTGYTGLRPATLPRIGTFELVRLSSLVCHGINATDHRSCRPFVLSPGDYFDKTDDKVLAPKPAATALDDFKKWVHVTSAKKPAGDGEDRAQNRTYWSATLEKADIGYSFYHHDPASQVQLKSEFAGIPQTQVLTANSIAISNDYRLRIVRSGRRWDRYLLAEESYEHDVKQANDDTRMDSQASNMIGFESGLNWRITPDGRRVPAVKLLVSARAETNPARPLASFSLKPGGTLVRPIDRQTRFPAKIGTRIENKVSWLEFGYQISRNLNSPMGYEFLDPVTRAVLATCGATAARQKSALAACISNVSDPSKTATPVTTTSDVTALTQDRWQQGIFLNFKLQVPLLRKDPYSVQYVMENTGNLYFHYFNQTDYSLDTHYLDTWTHSLAVKLVGNLSFAPKLQYLFYENMVDKLRMHSIATSVSLQYNFAWHSGMGWKNALSYADPTLKSSK